MPVPGSTGIGLSRGSRRSAAGIVVGVPFARRGAAVASLQRRAALAAELLRAGVLRAARRALDRAPAAARSRDARLDLRERVAERFGELVGVAEAMRRILRERHEAHVGEERRDLALGRDGARIVRRLGDVHEHDLRRALGLERAAAP